MKRFLVPLFLIFTVFISSVQSFAIDPKGTCPQGTNINGDEIAVYETAIGCISTSADGSGGFFEAILRLFVGLGGGLALILMLYGVFIVTTSAGIPDKLKEGSEIITSAIAGLIFILLSVFLLNLIGINILGLPGLS
jgi:hypothetical protein